MSSWSKIKREISDVLDKIFNDWCNFQIMMEIKGFFYIPLRFYVKSTLVRNFSVWIVQFSGLYLPIMKFRTHKSFKSPLYKTLILAKLISRKIWETENSWLQIFICSKSIKCCISKHWKDSVDLAQCENFSIFLKFYVKSILVILKPQNLLFWPL